MHGKKSITPVLAITLASVNYASLANAQEDSDKLKLEEVVVTSQRVEENLQNIPVAVTAFSAEDLERGGYDTFQDLQHTVPNLSMTVVTPFASWVNVRGIPSNPNGVFNSGTSAGLATYVDGVVYVRPSGFNQDLANVQQVEVLRGPQGTLFGQNSNLGVINIITKKPGDEFEGKLKLDVGNYDSVRATAYASGPLIEGVLAGSISYFQADRDGYSKNYHDGNKTDDEDRKTARVQLRYTPTDRFSADLNFEYLKDRSKSSNGDVTAIATLAEDPGNIMVPLHVAVLPDWSAEDIIIPGARTVSQNSEYDYNKRDNDGVDLTLQYELENGFVVKSITAQKNYDSLFGDDFDGTGIDLVSTNQQEDNSQFTQELQLISPRDSKLQYILGAFYMDLESEALQDSSIGDDHILSFLTGMVMTADVDTKSQSVFGHFNYDFTDSLGGFVGARYSDIEKDIDVYQSGAPGFPNPPLDFVDSDEDDFISWTMGLNYALDTQFNTPGTIYAKVSQGYKEAGFTVRFLTFDAIGGDPENPDNSFDREQVTSYEIGLKGTLLDERLRTNFAMFYLDYEDIQTTVLDPDTGSPRIENGPAATSQGLELELAYLINDYFRASGSVGYVDATFDDFDNCSSTVSCSGNKLPRASDWTGNLALDFNYPLDNGWNLFSGINASYRSSSYLTAQNIDLVKLDSVSLINLQGGVRISDYGLEIQAYVKNLTDEEYLTSISDYTLGGIFGTSTRRYGAPRTYGVRLTYDF